MTHGTVTTSCPFLAARRSAPSQSTPGVGASASRPRRARAGRAAPNASTPNTPATASAASARSVTPPPARNDPFPAERVVMNPASISEDEPSPSPSREGEGGRALRSSA